MTSPNAEPISVTLLIADIFEALNVQYFIGGSLASSVHGMPRSTNDVDLVADLRSDVVDGFVRALGDRFYVDPASIHDAIQQRATFNIIHLDTMLKIDIFIPRAEPLVGLELARAQRIVVSESPVRSLVFATAEDVVLEKLRWYRLGGEISDRQWNDVLGVLRTAANKIDVAYLREQSTGIAVADLLESALIDAGLLSSE